ncbi:hypothetical protein DRN74_02225 [Candidatus Micrarchaeota archaeon]|nr:MAG: hypothetical protein DRN74_02225 [Candidatus Micrarchaeota archaeon]
MSFKAYFRRNKIDILIVLSIFLLSFGIRTFTADKFPDIYGFDSFYAARQTKHIINGGWFPYKDNSTWYPYGRLQGANELGWWGLNALVYKTVALFNGVEGFNYNLFAKTTSWLVVIAGSLVIVFIFLFTKEIYGRFTGLMAALFLAASSNNLFYSIYGHAENDALGLCLLFASLWLFIMTIKKRNWRYVVLNLVSWTWLAMTWQSYKVGILLLSGTVVAYFVIQYILKEFGYYKESSEKKAYRKWLIIASFITMFSGPLQYLFNGRPDNLNVSIIILGFAVLLASLIELKGKAFFIEIKLLKRDIIRIASIISALLILSSFIFYGIQALEYPFSFIGIRITPSPPQRDFEIRMVQTIAEQNPIPGGNFLGRLSYLQNSFGYLIWFAFMAVVGLIAKILIMPFIRKDFKYEWDIFSVAFILFSMYFLTEKSITLFFLSAPVTLGAAIFIGEGYKIIDRVLTKVNKEEIKRFVKLSYFIIAIAIAFSYIVFIIPQAKTMGYDVPPEWFETFRFLNSSAVPVGSVITSWWDYGHWMDYYNGDKIHVSMDNIQSRKDVIYTVASSFTHTTPCSADMNTRQIYCDSSPEALEKAEIESLSLLKPLKTTHILIDKEIIGGSTGGKLGALEHIAANYIGCMQEIGCKEEDNKVKCLIGYDSKGKPVGFTFTKEQWQELKSVRWPGTNLNNQGLPARLFALETSAGRKSIFLTALQCGRNPQFDPNSPVLYAFLERLFFKDPNLKHVKLVFDNGWNVIYQVNWTGIPDPQNYSEWTKGHYVLGE